jgi:AraC-like DNA-binding protein
MSNKALGRPPVSFDERLLKWLVATPDLLEQVFDCLPDVLFYVKDCAGRYLWANSTLIRRSGLHDRAQVIGKTADQLFPVSGASTMAQDLSVVNDQRALRDLLRLYRDPRGDRYWCLSSKFPLTDADGRVVGLAGLSRDLPRPNERHSSYRRLATFIAYIESRPDMNVSIAQAADEAAISIDTLGRLVFEVFHLMPKQLVMKRRIDRACHLLEENSLSITEISAACGYADHSAFSRQFKTATQTTPARYRATHVAGGRSDRLRRSD